MMKNVYDSYYYFISAFSNDLNFMIYFLEMGCSGKFLLVLFFAIFHAKEFGKPFFNFTFFITNF